MSDHIVHVAVAVIVNDKNQVLIAKRADDAHQGGLWEFPGGKVEAGETVEQALIREIKEELNIVVIDSVALTKIKHNYKDKTVVLDVRFIKEYKNEPVGAEDQAIKWEDIVGLKSESFPAANKNIIAALQLPDIYMITGKFDSKDDFKEKLNNALSHGRRIVQLRCKDISDSKQYLELSAIAKSICEKFNTKLLLNTTVDNFNESRADGLNLNSHAVFEYKTRPISADKLLSVSCHNEEELKQAELLGADIILLSPVKETSSHPGVPGIGWKKFNQLVETVTAPVYALGGMNISDLEDAKESGAQGIAAISSAWVFK